MTFDCLLASELFDAAIDEHRWTPLLEKVAVNCGARSGAVISVNMAGNAKFQGVWGSTLFTPEVAHAYNTKFSNYESAGIPVIRDSERFSILTEHDLWPDEPDLRSRPDFVGLREMMGIDHRIVSRINEDRSWFNTFTLQFADGRPQATDDEKQVFASYLPFMAQAVKLANVFRRLKARFRAVLTVLDRYAVPVFVVDQQGNIIVSNDSADIIISQENGVGRDAQGRIRLSDSIAQTKLLDAVRSACATAIGDSDKAQSIFNAQRKTRDDPFCIEVSPLRDTDLELAGSLFTGALVKIYDPGYHPVIRIEAFATVYGLTTTEMSIAELLVHGAKTEEIAEIRGTSPATVTTQIKAILHKTGSQNRTDLVRRALSAHLPILTDS
jgi:DNA-binding NarL/FixJ family response regulator